MDIIKFGVEDGFQIIVWMDSDTITYSNAYYFLSRFADSQSPFYFVPDHVMYDKNYCRPLHQSDRQNDVCTRLEQVPPDN